MSSWLLVSRGGALLRLAESHAVGELAWPPRSLHGQRGNALAVHGVLPGMRMSTLRTQLRGVENSILTTELNIKRLEDLIAKLDETGEGCEEAERQLVSLRDLKCSFDQIRSGLLVKFQNPSATAAYPPWRYNRGELGILRRDPLCYRRFQTLQKG
jgi:hypothetical protein